MKTRLSYFVYMLRCADNTLYCGQTTDLNRRMKEHNSGNSKGARYTRSRRPVELVYFEKHKTRKKAMQRELKIKQWPRKRKLSTISTYPALSPVL